MPRYSVVIGQRELIVEAPGLQAALNAAMNEYPGEHVTAYAQLADEEDEATTEDGGGEGETEG